jgi:hypothetical protein
MIDSRPDDLKQQMKNVYWPVIEAREFGKEIGDDHEDKLTNKIFTEMHQDITSWIQILQQLMKKEIDEDKSEKGMYQRRKLGTLLHVLMNQLPASNPKDPEEKHSAELNIQLICFMGRLREMQANKKEFELANDVSQDDSKLLI